MSALRIKAELVAVGPPHFDPTRKAGAESIRQGVKQALRVFSGKEPGVRSAAAKARQAAHPRCNQRRARTQRLESRHAPGLATRGDDHHIGGLQPGPNVGLMAQRMNAWLLALPPDDAPIAAGGRRPQQP